MWLRQCLEWEVKVDNKESRYYRKLYELKNSDTFPFLCELLHNEISKHRNGLEIARGDDIVDMQGRIKGLRDILAFFNSLEYIMPNLNKSENSPKKESEIQKEVIS